MLLPRLHADGLLEHYSSCQPSGYGSEVVHFLQQRPWVEMGSVGQPA